MATENIPNSLEIRYMMQIINYRGKLIEIAAVKMELISLEERDWYEKTRTLLHLPLQSQEVEICMGS